MNFSIPNFVTDYKDYYVSYNNVDVSIYGDVTTALVLGQMDRFLILNGNHQKGYAEASKQGLQGCLQYFNDHIEQANKFSEHAKDFKLKCR